MTFQQKRVLLSIVFIALVVGPAVVMKLSTADTTHHDFDAAAQHEALARYGVALVESSRAAGIDFLHRSPRVDARLAHIEPQVAAMGASVSVVDFDGDGWQDFYVTTSAPGGMNALYRNRGDGTFEDVAAALGLADLNQPGTGACMGSVWADVDNDGFEDVLIYKWGRPELYLNEGGRGFRRVTDTSGLPEWINAGCATFLDFDNDGRVDLFIAGYWPDDVRLESLQTTRIMPESFEYANNGGRKWLLRNVGGGRFEDVTAEAGINSHRWTLAVVAADFDEDGYVDLFLANDYGVSELYINEGGRRFREIGRTSGVGHAPKSGMNAAVADVLNQGVLSIYETNISEQGVLIQGNNLWTPVSKGALRFENMAGVMGVEIGGWSFGAQFGDLNNDGYIDLYCTNGYVSAERGTSYWYDFSEIAGGHSSIIADAAHWPAMHGRSLSGYQHKRVWLNDGAGRFRQAAQAIGVFDTYDGRAVALADLDNNGSLDVLTANQRGPVLLYRNHAQPTQHWIALRLVGAASNRSAIGARVQVSWPGHTQVQQVTAASGYAAQNQRTLHFGLGEHDTVQRVVIRWPSGREQVVTDLAVDRIHTIEEPQ